LLRKFQLRIADRPVAKNWRVNSKLTRRDFLKFLIAANLAGKLNATA
jgi:hypothetical protein